MRIDLTGRRALVTGAGTDGIGRAAARMLAGAGAHVAVHHRAEPEAAATLAAECRGMALQADLSEHGAAADLVQRAVAGLGGLDILVGNAGLLLRKPLAETSEAEFVHVLSVNLVAQFALARAAVLHMTAGGRIVFTSSVNQGMPNPGLVAYGASKGGLAALSRQLALELAAQGVTVNCVAPGTIETDLNRTALADPAWRAAKQALIPAGRIGTSADAAGAILFLASDLAAYVTGTTITVDGGLSLMGMRP